MARRSIRFGIIAAAAALMLALVMLYAGLVASGEAGPKRTDFVPAYAAAQLAAGGHGGRVYDFARLGQTEAGIVRPLKVVDGVMPYLYPPALALLLAPLAHAGYDAAFLLWLLFNLIVLAVALESIRRYLGLDRAGSLLLFTVTASFLPVLVALAQGQVSILLLAAAASAMLALRSGRDILAGALMSILAIKPTYMLPILLVLLVRGRWRALGGTIGSLGIAAGAASAVFGLGILSAYAHVLLSASRWQSQIGGFSPLWNQSLYELTRLFGPGTAAPIAGLVLVAALATLLYWCARRAPTLDIPFTAAITVGLLASPHVLIHDLSLLVLPAAVVWRRSRVTPTARSAILLAGYLAVLLGAPIAAGAPLPPAALTSLGLGACLLLASGARTVRAVDTAGSPAIQRLPSPDARGKRRFPRLLVSFSRPLDANTHNT